MHHEPRTTTWDSYISTMLTPRQFIFAYAGKILQETAGEMLILSHAGKKTGVVIKFFKKKRSKDLNIQQDLSPMGV